MERIEIIKIIGESFLTSNIENGEFSYVQELKEKIKGSYRLDIRFYDNSSKVAVLVETKQIFSPKDKKQLFSYVALEQKISSNTKIIAILANTSNNKIKVWKIDDGIEEEIDDVKLKSFQEYIDYFKPKNINDKTAVLENTSKLNRILHDNGVIESLRSQFVGTCLLALKNGLIYKNIDTAQIIAGIKQKLGSLLNNSMDKATKLSILNVRVLQNQAVEEIESDSFHKLLDYINLNILPYINEATQEGHDILSYFFTTFNKYVAREDKNQAFTPNHISHFMCKIGGVTRVTKVLDPTCGSGTFVVQAMTQALQDCRTDKEREIVMKQNIYGIEKDENVFGLATTNMLIHGDGNSNIRMASCFDEKIWIEKADVDLVLMNPPYNASKNQVPREFGKTWGKASTDPSKGLFFVSFIAECVKRGRLVTLLPMACAVSNKGIIGNIKQELLEHHTLDAVFSFPDEMFYPGASAVACCMVFDLGKPHPKDNETFFGYFKNDGFEKRKGIGRTDAKNEWAKIEKEWIDLYNHRSSVAGKSVIRKITAEDEWCAEAYMETDYSTITDEDFIKKMRDYAAFLVQNEDF
jgi:type I restriction-modification system DNA methylase subunit